MHLEENFRRLSITEERGTQLIRALYYKEKSISDLTPDEVSEILDTWSSRVYVPHDYQMIRRLPKEHFVPEKSNEHVRCVRKNDTYFFLVKPSPIAGETEDEFNLRFVTAIMKYFEIPD